MLGGTTDLSSAPSAAVATEHLASLEPFLKWPGGKRLLVDNIAPLFRGISGKYFEPFLGGAAVFFHLRPAGARLSDSNPELINCYVAVRDRLDDVLAEL